MDDGRADEIGQNGNDGDHYYASNKYWKKTHNYRWDNGDYTISASRTGESVRYTSWHKNNMINVHDNPQSARNACQSHFTITSSKS